MARAITKYLDSDGKEYATEEEADRADRRRVVEKLLDDCCGEFEFQFDKLEHMNSDTLRPLYDYIAMLMQQSDERTRKFG